MKKEFIFWLVTVIGAFALGALVNVFWEKAGAFDGHARGSGSIVIDFLGYLALGAVLAFLLLGLVDWPTKLKKMTDRFGREESRE